MNELEQKAYDEERARLTAIKQIKKEENARKNKKIFYWLGGIFVVMMIFSAIQANDPSSDLYNNQSNNIKKEAFDFAQDAVLSKLKAPATAKFSDFQDAVIESEQKNGLTVYRILGHVDSQNSFGALIRSKYEVYLRREKSGKFTLGTLEIN